MSLLSLLLVILAAFIHATWNLLAKRAASSGASFVFASTGVSCICYLPWALWLFSTSTITWSYPVIGCIVLSGVLHLVYSLSLQRGYQIADLSVVYPIARGTAPMLSTVAAFLLLGEHPKVTGVTGVAVIVIGILLICTQGSLAKFREPAAQRGVRWGTATGSVIASYTVVDAYGVKLFGIHPVVLDWCSQLARFTMLFPWAFRHRYEIRAAMKRRWSLAIAVGLLSPLSYILVLLALQTGAPLSLVAPAREMSMMVGALLGMIILREKVSIWRLAGCLAMALGVLLLARS